MKLTRAQERALANIGLQKLLESLGTSVITTKRIPWNKGLKSNRKQKWSKAQHAKFSKTMKAKWEAKVK